MNEQDKNLCEDLIRAIRLYESRVEDAHSHTQTILRAAQAIERLSGELEEWKNANRALRIRESAALAALKAQGEPFGYLRQTSSTDNPPHGWAFHFMSGEVPVYLHPPVVSAGPEPVAIALHYPECWDTAAYPTVWDALAEVVSWFKCSNDDCQHPPVVSEDAKDAAIDWATLKPSTSVSVFAGGGGGAGCGHVILDGSRGEVRTGTITFTV